MLSRSLAASALSLAVTVPALAFAAPAAAAVVQMTPAGELRIDGFEDRANAIDIRYEPSGGGLTGLEPRFVLDDTAGVFAIAGSSCLVAGPETITCDAAPVVAISAGLGDGDDVMAIDLSVPARYSASIRGGNGNDVLKGGPGEDRVAGNAGRDIVAGGPGADRLLGGPGVDGVIGFGGDDVMSGGPGDDALFGQKGRDVFRGGAGSDVLLARDNRADRRIDCGAGKRERAVTDRRDPRPRGCRAPRKKKRR